MRKSINVWLIVLGLVIILSAAANAQSPSTITYQGVLANADGVPIDVETDVTFSIYTVSSGGSAIWTETIAVTPDANGVFTVELGLTTPLTTSFFSGGRRYLGIKVGTDAEMSPRQVITSSPYSISTQGIPDNSVNSSKILNGSVNVVDLNTSARPAVGVISLGSTGATGTTSTSPTLLESFTVSVPASGYLVVTLYGTFLVNADAPSTASIRRLCNIGLCTTANSSSTCGDTWITVDATDPDNASSFNDVYPFTVTRVFSVTAGNRTFYINGATDVAGEQFILWDDSFAQVQFFPATLSVSAPPVPESEGVTAQGLDLSGE
jgi:hypothetical protein